MEAGAQGNSAPAPMVPQEPSSGPSATATPPKREEGVVVECDAPVLPEEEEVTYSLTGRTVLACEADWQLELSTEISAGGLLSRLRQCLCIDWERLDMFKRAFEREQEEFKKSFEFMKGRLARYQAEFLQTLPLMPSVISELKADLVEAYCNWRAVQGIAADVQDRTEQLIQEYDDLDIELCTMEERSAVAVQTPGNSNNQIQEESQTATDATLKEKARLKMIDRTVTAKEREHRAQLRLSVTEENRKELVEVGDSVFPNNLTLASITPLWAEPLSPPAPVSETGRIAPPPTPTHEHQELILLGLAPSVFEIQLMAFTQLSALASSQQAELRTETGPVENMNTDDSDLSDSAAAAAPAAPPAAAPAAPGEGLGVGPYPSCCSDSSADSSMEGSIDSSTDSNIDSNTDSSTGSSTGSSSSSNAGSSSSNSSGSFGNPGGFGTRHAS
ncbi:hypothetical protein, conserved [Eimeria brunetti]|uniref:Uncharacterized protein n=1 Tax=Eimeria brunetti TaxID=51314 RepID=U6LAK2_9EIME|nr:hypothetical protein, conserved [Eimeria brunetti]